MGKLCEYPGCKSPALAKGLCSKHYIRRSKLVDSSRSASHIPVHVYDFHAIYVVGAFGVPYVKIGRAANPYRRITEMQVGNPYVIAPFGFRFSHPSVIRAMEWEIHAVLTEMDTHYRGEWFDIHPSDALAVIDKISDDVSTDILDVRAYEKLRAENMEGNSVGKSGMKDNAFQKLMYKMDRCNLEIERLTKTEITLL